MKKQMVKGLDFVIELDVNFIGGGEPLTKEEERKISEFIKSRKLKQRVAAKKGKKKVATKKESLSE